MNLDFLRGYDRLPKVTFCGISDFLNDFYNRWNNGRAWNWRNDLNSSKYSKLYEL